MFPAGYRIPVHTHPVTERVTVLSGNFHLGIGTFFGETKAGALTPGSRTRTPRFRSRWETEGGGNERTPEEKIVHKAALTAPVAPSLTPTTALFLLMAIPALRWRPDRAGASTGADAGGISQGVVTNTALVNPELPTALVARTR